ncbi:hypothetical protein TRICI_004274 [Trichomonascus ciferrii]|uniref:Secreted protein n=1 Tax=Trichomonascus ciferrii TaxID=44093 RepID=A0A642V1C0_9ASCO|nr:hypothetical protein TRICI_004274 [Trichomonascus ciferrii]
MLWLESDGVVAVVVVLVVLEGELGLHCGGALHGAVVDEVGCEGADAEGEDDGDDVDDLGRGVLLGAEPGDAVADEDVHHELWRRGERREEEAEGGYGRD